ncbi:MAG: hypothetical protein Fur0022_32930 [Anaerolineales bacterium]
MQKYVGKVSEFQFSPEGKLTVQITCPPQAIPMPGQYLLVHAPHDEEAPLAHVIFPAHCAGESFVAAPPVPATWQIGTSLHLRGPLGKGFQLPGPVRNLALISLGETVSRLLPLLALADNSALFTSSPLHLLSPSLPSSLEINPLSDLPAALRWANFLAFDLPLARLLDLPKLLDLAQDDPLPCPAQALIFTPMPCGGIADCGVCAVGRGSKSRLACTEGPVFDVRELLRG